MPLFIESVVLPRKSMKLCVCEPAKSHSCVRHSRYTLLIIAKLTSAAAAFCKLFIVEYLMHTGQVEQYEYLPVYFHLNFNWTSHVVIIIYAHELKSELLNRIRSGGLVINWYWWYWQRVQHYWGSRYEGVRVNCRCGPVHTCNPEKHIF